MENLLKINLIVQYQQPKANESNKLTYSNLGEENIDDYSDKNNLYVDYKKAHENNYLINPNEVNYRTYNSVNELKNNRENIEKLMEEELNEQAKYEEEEKYREWERLERLKLQDTKASNHFNKINKLMLRK